MADRLRLGLIGLGSAGRRRLAAARRHPRVDVVAVCDPGVVVDAPAETDAAALLARPDLDAVCVAVPNAAAPALVVAARRRGLAVLVEKPPARSAAEFEAILEPGPPLRVGFNHRWHHSLQAARELLAAGALGRLESVDGLYRRATLGHGWRLDRALAGGGILLDQGIHLVDAIRWLVGPLRPVSWSVEGAPMETAVEARLQGAVPVTVRSRADGPPAFRLVLRGRLASLTLDGLVTSSGAYAPETLVLDGPSPQQRRWDDDPSWDRELEGFVRHVLDGHDDGHGDPRDALAVLRLVDALRRPMAVEARP